MPRWLGRILILGGGGYVLSAFVGYGIASAPSWLVEALPLPATVGEFWMIGYLLLRGIRHPVVDGETPDLDPRVSVDPRPRPEGLGQCGQLGRWVQAGVSLTAGTQPPVRRGYARPRGDEVGHRIGARFEPGKVWFYERAIEQLLLMARACCIQSPSLGQADLTPGRVPP